MTLEFVDVKPRRMTVRERLLDVLTRSRAWLTTQQIAQRVGVHDSTAAEHLRTLHATGEVEKRIPETKAKPGRYSLARLENATEWRAKP